MPSHGLLEEGVLVYTVDTLIGEIDCCACSVASGAFHGPCSVGGLGVLISPLHQPAISSLGTLKVAESRPGDPYKYEWIR